MNELSKGCGVEPRLTISEKERELTDVLTEMQETVNRLTEAIIGNGVNPSEKIVPNCLDEHIGMNLENAKKIREQLKDLMMHYRGGMKMQNNEITIPMEEYKELLEARAIVQANRDFRYFLQDALIRTIDRALPKEGVEDATN